MIRNIDLNLRGINQNNHIQLKIENHALDMKFAVLPVMESIYYGNNIYEYIWQF